MKRFLIVIIFMTLLTTGSVYAKTEEMVSQLGDMTVKLTMEMTLHKEDGHHSSLQGEHHNSMGANVVEINIYNSDGKTITDAKIKISYSMPPVNNMPPMKYTSRAKLDGDTYRANLNFSMKGEWDIVVYIMGPGKDLAKADFKMHIM